MNKTERIKALLAHTHNPIKDQKVLEGMTDETLKTLEAHTASLDQAFKDAETKLDAETKVTAELKAAASKGLTEEEFLAAAPPSLRTMIDRHKAADVAAHTGLVAKLKTAQVVFTEDALKLKTLEQLQEMATLLKIEQPIDYSLRVPRAAETADDYKTAPPPDGYAIALEKRKAGSTTH